MTYRVRDWDKYFENNRTRELRSLAWLPIPNKHDGDGYTELVDHENGAAHLGAWVTILQVASKCRPRGTLLRDGAMPHDAASLARKTRLPRAIFEAVLPRLLSIGWLEQVLDTTGDIEMSQEDAMPPQEGAGIPQDSALEGKGREGKVKGREKGKSAPQNDLEPLPPEAFDIAKKLNIPPALLVLRYKARRDPIWILAALLRTADRAHQMPALKSPQAYFARLCRDEEPPNDAALEEAGLIVKGWRSRQNQDAIPAMPKAVQEAIGKGESQ